MLQIILQRTVFSVLLACGLASCSQAVVPEMMLDKTIATVDGHPDVRVLEYRERTSYDKGAVLFVKYEKNIDGKWYQAEQHGKEFVLTIKGDRDLRRDHLPAVK